MLRTLVSGRRAFILRVQSAEWVLLEESSGSQPGVFIRLWKSHDPFPGVTCQLVCILDISSMIHNGSKITATNWQQDNFIIGESEHEEGWGPLL